MQTNKKIISRIAILSHGRKSYLEFLRNLTPPTILFALALYLGAKINVRPFEFQDIFRIIIIITFITLSLTAFYINASMLLDCCLFKTKRFFNGVISICKSRGYKPLKTVCAVISAFYSRKIIEGIEFVLIYFFLQLSFVIIIVVATFQAVGMMNINP